MKAADIVDGVRRESGSSKEVDVDPSKMIRRTVSPTPPPSFERLTSLLKGISTKRVALCKGKHYTSDLPDWFVPVPLLANNAPIMDATQATTMHGMP